MYYIYALGNRIDGPFATETEAEDARAALIFGVDSEICDVVPLEFDGVWNDVDVDEIIVQHEDFE